MKSSSATCCPNVTEMRRCEPRGAAWIFNRGLERGERCFVGTCSADERQKQRRKLWRIYYHGSTEREPKISFHVHTGARTPPRRLLCSTAIAQNKPTNPTCLLCSVMNPITNSTVTLFMREQQTCTAGDKRLQRKWRGTRADSRQQTDGGENCICPSRSVQPRFYHTTPQMGICFTVRHPFIR